MKFTFISKVNSLLEGSIFCGGKLSSKGKQEIRAYITKVAYQFSFAAVIYYHKLKSGLNDSVYYFYSSGGEKSEMGLNGLKSRHWQPMLIYGGSGEESVFCLFHLLEAAHISFWSSSSIFKSKQHCIFLIILLHVKSCSFSFKNPGEDFQPFCIVRIISLL